MQDRILSMLPGDYPWKAQFHWVPSLGSTNDHLRTLAKAGAPQGTAIIAGRQTNGHGRRGRSFHSPEGAGIYLSILLRPDCAPGALMHLTCATAVAMCDAVEAVTGLRPGIKWTNDLVFEKRKLGGILTELGFTAQGAVDYAIIGIGLNCNHRPEDFPEDIRSIAASLAMVTGNPVCYEQTAAAMLEALWKMDSGLLSRKAEMMSRYRRDCITLGQEILLVRGDEQRHGVALDIDGDGALLVRFLDGATETVNSGEVSVRGMYGYL